MLLLELKKCIRARVIVETRLDLVFYPYIQVIDIWELKIGGSKNGKKDYEYIYDKWIGERYQWKEDKNEKRRAIFGTYLQWS